MAAEPGGAELAVASVKQLSARGSTRATFYPQSNKVVTLDGRTHVGWLDSISEIMVAGYDHGSGRWDESVKVGTGYDNHGGPALTCDSEGYLHIIFGPHHGPFQHCRSVRPNDSSTWTKLPDFGENATYPSIVCDEADTLHMIYRGGGGAPKLLYQRKPKGGQWTSPRVLARAPIESGYTHYHCELAIAPDRRTLHVAYDIYYGKTAKCAGHMMSVDRGNTWTLADGSPLKLPVMPEADAFIARAEPTLRTWSMVCDSKGRPWISVKLPEELRLYHHDGKEWRWLVPARLTSPELGAGKLGGYIPMTVDAHDRLYVMATLAGSVVVLFSPDQGKSFQLLHVCPPHEKLPHRGMNMERSTGHHRVDVPWLLFCTGEKGKDCYGKGLFNLTQVVRLSVTPGTQER